MPTPTPATDDDALGRPAAPPATVTERVADAAPYRALAIHPARQIVDSVQPRDAEGTRQLLDLRDVPRTPEAPRWLLRCVLHDTIVQAPSRDRGRRELWTSAAWCPDCWRTWTARAAAERANKAAAAARFDAVRAALAVTTPDPEAVVAVTITVPRSTNRYVDLTRIQGPRDAVLGYTAHLLATATCTPCYEHMLPRLAQVDHDADGILDLTLSESRYAGD